MTWLVACEESGAVRDALLSRGIDAVSCDLLPTASPGPHIQGDVTGQLSKAWAGIIAFPDCTYLTCSAEWAYGNPNYRRYPGAGYHQKVKPNTLVGAARRAARQRAIKFVNQIITSNRRVVLENPVGVLSRHIGKAQVIQPYMFGDDASKKTCIWSFGLPDLVIPDPGSWYPPRMVSGKPRWSNQTDSGQNKLSPGPDRARDRSRTYPGIANAIADLVEGVSK